MLSYEFCEISHNTIFKGPKKLSISAKKRHCTLDVRPEYCQDVFKTSWRHLGKTSWRRLEDVLKTSWRHIAKTNILVLTKTSSKRFLKTKTKDVFKTSWRRLHQDKCLLGSLRSFDKSWGNPYKKSVTLDNLSWNIVNCQNIMTRVLDS